MRELRRQWIGRDLLGPLARPPRPTVIPYLPPSRRSTDDEKPHRILISPFLSCVYWVCKQSGKVPHHYDQNPGH